MLKQSLKAFKLFQHRFNVLSTRFNNVEREWQTLPTLPFNKIERMLKQMLKPFARALTPLKKKLSLYCYRVNIINNFFAKYQFNTFFGVIITIILQLHRSLLAICRCLFTRPKVLKRISVFNSNLASNLREPLPNMKEWKESYSKVTIIFFCVIRLRSFTRNNQQCKIY